MVKLFVNQIAITVFASMVSIAIFQNRSALLWVSIFSILFFLYLNYNSCWEIGAKDKLHVDTGRLDPCPMKGLYLSIGANVPNIIIASLIGIGAVINTAASQGMSIVCDILARFLNNMYFGVMNFLEYAIYRNAHVADALTLLRDSAAVPEVSEAIEIISNESYTISDLTQAIDTLGKIDSPTDAVADAAELLYQAAHSPQIIENWWWFLVIIIPSLLVGWGAYYLGSKNIRIRSVLGIKPREDSAQKK